MFILIDGTKITVFFLIATRTGKTEWITIAGTVFNMVNSVQKSHYIQNVHYTVSV
jgi:hypothetical protein